jgi:hypothetical protein
VRESVEGGVPRAGVGRNLHVAAHVLLLLRPFQVPPRGVIRRESPSVFVKPDQMISKTSRK